MNKLKLVDTATVKPGEDDTTLVEYWRRKYEQLQDESTPAALRSLRSQLQTIQSLAEDPGDHAEETLKAIATHARLGLMATR